MTSAPRREPSCSSTPYHTSALWLRLRRITPAITFT